MRGPLRYITENVGHIVGLAEPAIGAGYLRFVLSSTPALFGFPERRPLDEGSDLGPVSPYGASKMTVEQALDWAVRLRNLRFASLRYFNAAGANPGGRLGEDHNPETHLTQTPSMRRWAMDHR
jgi:UDP-glucose 4-epimerase